MINIRLIFIWIVWAANFSLSATPNFMLIGPPGSGKGTFSSFLVQHYGYYHIYLGDIIRDHITRKTEIGVKLEPFVEKRDGFDPQIIYKIIHEQVSYCLEKHQPFIIDGSPRSIDPSDSFIRIIEENNLASNLIFVHFRADDQTCTNRIGGRCVCPHCFTVFNQTTKKPKKDMTCDQCNTKLVIRPEDTLERVKKRLAQYRTNTEPLVIEWIKQHKFSVFDIDTQGSIDDCLNAYKNLATTLKLEQSYEQ